MPKQAEYVHYNDGEKTQFALVTGTSAEDSNTLDLLVFDGNGVGQVEASVPRREPADYGPEGGGRTWAEPA